MKQLKSPPVQVKENVYAWNQLTHAQRKLVIELHAKAVKPEYRGLTRRVFNVGKPKIVAAYDWSHIRVHEDSLDAIKALSIKLFEKKKFPRKHVT